MPCCYLAETQNRNLLGPVSDDPMVGSGEVAYLLAT